jgi:hypothetical protein
MKRLILSTVAALAFLAPVPSYAQTTGVAVEIVPEQRTRIKQYVVEEKVAPARITERVTVGATLPAEVELHAVPQTWGPSVSRYRYVYYNDNVVLVEPSSRRVIHIID